MKNDKLIHSPNPDIDTLKCPKCNTLWRAEGYYNYDEGGWNYGMDQYCPNNCKSLFGFPIEGKVYRNPKS